MEVAGWFVGAGVGAVFTVLYDGVKELLGRPTKFQVQLEALELTLESFDLEVIQQIGWHNDAMGLPNGDVKALEEELNKGVRIIRELSDACLWRRIDSGCINRLVQLNRSLTVLEKRLKLQSIRDVKETRHMMQILLVRLTLHQEPGIRDIGSTPRLLDIAPQEALHHIMTFDQVSNIESTNTILPQFHGGDEIQEVGSSSDHLPSPLENFNFRGTGNQLQIDDGQLVTTSNLTLTKIVIQVSLVCINCKRKALKTVTGINGILRVSIDSVENRMVVTGADVDACALLNLLRKHIHHAEILAITSGESQQIPFQEQQIISTSARRTFWVKLSKFFKPKGPYR